MRISHRFLRGNWPIQHLFYCTLYSYINNRQTTLLTAHHKWNRPTAVRAGLCGCEALVKLACLVKQLVKLWLMISEVCPFMNGTTALLIDITCNGSRLIPQNWCLWAELTIKGQQPKTAVSSVGPAARPECQTDEVTVRWTATSSLSAVMATAVL